MPNSAAFVCGEQLIPDGNINGLNMRSDVYGAVVNSDGPGQQFTDTLQGRSQIFTVTTPAALLISATTGNCPTIWNPSTSGKILVITKLMLGFVSGTTTIGSVLWAKTTAQAGTAVIATNGPIITFTSAPSSIFNGSVGGPNAKTSAMLWAPAVSTFVAAPTVFAPTGINLGAASPTNGGNIFSQNYDGNLILWPGFALSLVYSVTTSTSLFWASIFGIEKPLPQVQ